MFYRFQVPGDFVAMLARIAISGFGAHGHASHSKHDSSKTRRPIGRQRM
jgi:hypothetical protein